MTIAQRRQASEHSPGMPAWKVVSIDRTYPITPPAVLVALTVDRVGFAAKGPRSEMYGSRLPDNRVRSLVPARMRQAHQRRLGAARRGRFTPLAKTCPAPRIVA